MIAASSGGVKYSNHREIRESYADSTPEFPFTLPNLLSGPPNFHRNEDKLHLGKFASLEMLGHVMCQNEGSFPDIEIIE
jgi:hypothetical protein